jgi:hypothetical protein
VAQTNLETKTSEAKERIAQLNNETERLKGDNLALQTVLLPRHVGLIGRFREREARRRRCATILPATVDRGIPTGLALGL